MSAAGFLSVWEFRVAPEHVETFERTYGPEGEWVRLFRRASGYVRTELHRDRQDPLRFLTVDYWESAAHWSAFRARHAREYESLDARCAGLTLSESAIGQFEPVVT
jgi:heme-degrading monooxygenase HmoA